MQINVRNIGEIITFDIEGKLDTQSSTSALEELLEHLSSKPMKVLISLETLEFISSSGLRILLRVAKEVKSYSGIMKVCGAQNVVKEVLEISGFDSLLDLIEDEEKAVASF
jgi:anti-anti-sigma factor